MNRKDFSIVTFNDIVNYGIYIPEDSLNNEDLVIVVTRSDEDKDCILYDMIDNGVLSESISLNKRFILYHPFESRINKDYKIHTIGKQIMNLIKKEMSHEINS